jgi:hypothetical protein
MNYWSQTREIWEVNYKLSCYIVEYGGIGWYPSLILTQVVLSSEL